MKSLFKLSIIALVVLSSGIVFAQVNATANVSATVQNALTITKNNDVAFGNLSANSAPVLDANDQSNTDVTGTYQIGDYTIGGSNGASVNVSYDASVTLGDGTAATMTFTPDVAGDASSSNQASAAGVTSGASITLGATGYTLWIGGNLGTLSGQASGSYSSAATNGSGDFTVTVSYN